MASSFLCFFKKFVTVLLVWQSYIAVSGEIIVSPKDKEASVGESIELVCATTADAIEWHHLRAGTYLPEIVYKDGLIFNDYKGRFNEKNCRSAGGECKLIIQNVILNDAGTYTCVDNSEESAQKAAQLIVFEKYPSTQFCLNRTTCSLECTMELSCNMTYRGNVEASMEWRDAAGALVPSTNITINDITISTVQITNSQSTTYTCRVKYPTITLQSRYNWTHKPQDFSASITAQDGQNDPIVTKIPIVVVVILSGIALGLIGYNSRRFLIGYNIRRRILERKSRRSSSSDSEKGSTQSGNATQQLDEPLMKNDPELDSSWTEGVISPRTKSNKNKAIHGLSVVDDELFLITREGCIVEVFDLITSNFKRAFSVVGLVNPYDMVSCSNRKLLYICDWKKSAEDKEIICVDTQGAIETRWISENEKGRLSITSESHVIVAESWYNTIKEYSSNGQLKRRFQAGQDKLHLWHAIKLLNGNFVASFGDSQDVFQDVCVLDNQGLEIHSFAKTSTNQSIAVPRTLAVDGDGNIYVADLYNRRIIMLTSELQWKGELHMAKTGERLRGPLRICLHEMNDKRQILVADNKKENGKWIDGKIQILDIQ